MTTQTTLAPDTIKQVLNHFCSTDELRPWMCKPFGVGENLFATNGFDLVICPMIEGKYQESPDKITKVWPLEHTLSDQFSLAELKDKFDTLPKEERFKYSQGECEACDGGGEVIADFWHDRKLYNIAAECPLCDGFGYRGHKISLGLEVADYSYFRIKQAIFMATRVKGLIYAAEQAGVDTIQMVSQVKIGGSLFILGDIQLLIMACSSGDPKAGIL